MRRIGLLAFACYLGSIPLANWMIGHVGFCAADAPCVLPVAPLPNGHALMAPSGVVMAGLALVFRDVVQRCLGLAWGLAAVFAGAVLSAFVAPPALVLASGAAFLLSELADFAVYTPLQRRGLMLAVVASCALGLVMDSVVFLGLAFGSLAFLPGQIVGKAWAVLISLPLIRFLRRVAPSPRVKLSDFDFDLPPERIAHTPVRPRNSARLLVVGDALQDRIVRELPALLRPGDILVANNTRVIPAQLEARRGEARIGITLDQPRRDGSWHALARNARRIAPGDTLRFAGGLTAEVLARDPDGGVSLRFDRGADALGAALQEAGALALPPYIDRPAGPTEDDRSDYQTVFAAREGAVAAPTAGLHFTPGLLAALDAAGVRRTTITLHVGAGTFLPVRTEDVAQHRMHSERGEITPDTVRAITEARVCGGRVLAIGTTSLRILEAATDEHGVLHPFGGSTDLFILPGYRFRAVDLLLTNFHLPRSTLFMLVSAFAGQERMRAAYAHAVEAGYRFFSYGDATLLERA